MLYNTPMITLYSADWCAYCHATKQYLDKQGATYEEKNIEKNPEFAIEAEKISGQTGIPVIDIDGKIIIGFNRPEVEKALNK